jgi:predicted SprT family Zn-dependent metalloprotease
MNGPPARIPVAFNSDTLARWLTQWSGIWQVPRLDDNVDIRFSRRMRTSLGRCRADTGRININSILLQEHEELLKEVVCHEVAHVVAYLRHGKRALPHGREWKQFMVAAGYEPRARVRSGFLSRHGEKTMLAQGGSAAE